MRILMMADTPMHPDSGAAGTEYQTMLALRRLGHEVDAVWATNLPHKIKHGNLHYLLELPFAYRKMMLRHLSNRSYDVIHVNQPHGYLAARALKNLPSAPIFVHRSHGFEPRAREVLACWRTLYKKPRPLLQKGMNKIMASMLELNNHGIARYSGGHIFSSSLCGEYLKQRYQVPHHRIAIIHQAPPQEYLDAPSVSYSPIRLDRILYVGQYAFFKGSVILAQAFDAILDTQPKARLTWVCDSRHHEAAAKLLTPRARERVRFLDWLPQQELRQVYDEHGVFLFPSFFEGFGKAFIEAMARGLIVIASEEGGAKDLIHTDLNGFLVPVGDAEAIAKCYDKIVLSSGVEDISRAARDTAARHTWGRVAQETVAFYSRLIKKQNRQMTR